MASPFQTESDSGGAMDTPRTKFIDFDARRQPKTDHWCIRCQRDLKPSQPYREVHVVNGCYSVHPDGPQPAEHEVGVFAMGMDCARLHGMEWTRAVAAACECDCPRQTEGDQRAMMLGALREIAFLRPGGPTRNKMVEAMERIAIDAIDAITKAEGRSNG